MMKNTECILFYVKYPEPGKVKTRLAKGLGDERAVELYKRFIQDLNEMLSDIPQQVCVCYAPDKAEPYFRERLGNDFLYAPQQGIDLGERMKHSFQQAFQEGFERVAIVGSDSPDLSAQIVSQAFDELGRSDAVIGPALDGGYYLLGFRKERFFPDVFDDMSWSTSIVFDQTRKKLDEALLRYSVLAEWNDIDTLLELERFIHRCQQNGSGARHTQAYCRTLTQINVKGVKNL